MSNYQIIKLNRLNAGLAFNISNMVQQCEQEDHASYDIFLDNGENCNDMNCFYICMEDRQIIGFLSFFMPSLDDINIYACTLPSHRRKGIFTALFSVMQEEFHIQNLSTGHFMFPVHTDSPAYAEAIRYLTHRQYHICNTEYLMKYTISPHVCPADGALLQASLSETTDSLELEYEETELENEYSLWLGDTYIGGCLICYSAETKTDSADTTTATIYEYGIIEPYQGLGYGKSGLKQILSSLTASDYNISSVILHVNGNNKKACNLYLSCGFHIIEKVDYYLNSFHDG